MPNQLQVSKFPPLLPLVVSPAIPGHTYFSIPAYSFLIEHPSSRSLLFDLGVRKDWENLAPRVTDCIKDGGWKVTVQKGVREQLKEHGVSAANIETIIWSHWHLDHTGNPSTFNPSTALFVGPGFKNSFTPGYPSTHPPLSSKVIIPIVNSARYPSTPVLELEAFYAVERGEDGKGVAHDVDEAEETIEKVMEADASDEVLVIMAHDDTLKVVGSFFPLDANTFRQNNWAEKGRLLFLRDFVGGLKDSIL